MRPTAKIHCRGPIRDDLDVISIARAQRAATNNALALPPS